MDNTTWCLHFWRETGRQAWKRQVKKAGETKTTPSPTSTSILHLEIGTHGIAVLVTALRAAAPQDSKFSTSLDQEHPQFQEASLHQAAAQKALD